MTLRLAGVGHAYADGRAALDAVELEVRAGERIAVIGPSGAGKTTLLRLLASHLRPATGRVELLGEDPWQLGERGRQRLRRRIALLHQAPPLPARQRVVTAVLAGRLGHWSLGRSLLSLLHPLDIGGAEQALARLDLADRLFQRCGQLSGGQLQRVGIARALYQQPDLFLADEPVSALDPVLASHALGVLTEAAGQRNATLLASLHAVDLALAHFPRIIGLRAGRILFDRPAEAVSADELAALYANDQLQSASATQAAIAPALTVPRC